MTTKPFDSSLKELIELDTPSWGLLAGSGGQQVELVDADVSTVSGAADKVLRVGDPAGRYLVDLEPESGHAGGVPDKLLFNSIVLTRRHGLPVRSVALLLRSEAQASTLTGVLERSLAGGEGPYVTFRYAVVRVWELPLESLLLSGLGTLVMAPLTDEAQGDLGAVVKRVTARVRSEARPEQVGQYLSAVFLLLGLRLEAGRIQELIRGVTEMEESSTYQLILARGEERGEVKRARATLLCQGRLKFGEPSSLAVTTLDRIDDISRLETLLDRLIAVNSWDELLASL